MRLTVAKEVIVSLQRLIEVIFVEHLNIVTCQAGKRPFPKLHRLEGNGGRGRGNENVSTGLLGSSQDVGGTADVYASDTVIGLDAPFARTDHGGSVVHGQGKTCNRRRPWLGEGCFHRVGGGDVSLDDLNLAGHTKNLGTTKRSKVNDPDTLRGLSTSEQV